MIQDGECQYPYQAGDSSTLSSSCQGTLCGSEDPQHTNDRSRSTSVARGEPLPANRFQPLDFIARGELYGESFGWGGLFPIHPSLIHRGRHRGPFSRLR